jgi:metal-responsive CopG/Arc/MetJ family transcriptional regulator
MKVETSLLLSEDILGIVDKLKGQYQNRSEWSEMALRTFMAQITPEKEIKDIDIINKKF